MRWRLVLLVGLLAVGGAAAALVYAQDGSSGGATSSLGSRPGLAAPQDGYSPLRAAGRSGGLAQRLQQVRQSAAEEYTPHDALESPLQPAPESSSAAPAETNSAGVFAPAGASVLKQRASLLDAPQARTATLDASPSLGQPAPAAAADEFQPPAGARPLGSPPPGARALGNPAPTAPQSTDRELTPLTPPPASDDATWEVPSSRRRPIAPPAISETQAPTTTVTPPARIETVPIPFRGALGGKESVLVGATPQLRIEAQGPKAAIRGRPASYTMIISNVGDAAARGVEVHIESRQAVEFGVGEASHGEAELHRSPAGGAVLLWSIHELPRGAKAELALTALARETRPFELTASWTCAPTVAAAQVEVLEPQLAMTLSGPKDVMFGETKIYTITLTNPGTGDAENVTLALAPLSSNQEPPPPRNVGTLRAGERKEIPIQLTAREAGILAIHAEATSEGGLHAEASEQVVVRRAQIQLAVEGPGLKYAGSSAEYRVRVINAGNAPAENLTLQAALPSGVEYAPGSDGGAVQAGGVAWRVGSLAPGDERTFTFVCALHEEGEKQFTFKAAGADEVEATAAVSTKVEALADLKLSVNDPPGAIPVGKEVTYEVRVLNRGTKAAAGIEISAFFSEGIEPIGVEGAQANLTTGQVTAAPVASLPAGAEIVLKIKAKADRSGNHIFRAVVQCTNPETRLAAEEATRFFGAAQTAPAESESNSFQPTPAPLQPPRM